MTAVAPHSTEALSPAVERDPKSRRHGRLWRVLAWLGIGLVFVLVLELTCRIEDWVTYGTPILSRAGSLEDLVVRDADGMHARPNAQFQKWKINSLGMRGPERAAVPAPGTVRVITSGASETFGLRESAGKEYPRQLEDSLAAWTRRGVCGSSPSTEFEVLNSAFAGMSLPTVEQDVRLRLHRLRPAIIVVYPSSVQYLEDKVPHPAKPDSGAARPLALSRAFQPRILARLREQVKQLLPATVKRFLRAREVRSELQTRPPGWRFDTLPSARLALFEEDLRHLIGTIRGIGAEPLLVTHANMFMGRKTFDREMLGAWEKFYPRATGSVIVAFDSAARNVTMQVGADSGVVTVDAAKRLAAAPASDFGDFVHFTDSGASVMAEQVGRGVLAIAAREGACRPLTTSSRHARPTQGMGGRD